MATPSQAWAVKSLNKSSGRKRYVFKNFSQRLEEIDVNVFRSLDPLKSEPSEGSSFFRDCLIEWRELNTAEDFISFYEEMLPWVQTLPQVILHKETIISKLLSRLQMKARLSLEPILRLIAALSRDLLEDFCPFLQRISDSLVALLRNGAEKEPEILEQIFTSWSFLMMYLQKYLIRDVAHVLKITVHIRYYPKDYVQEFMAEAISFLLRNAPEEQLKKGIKKIIHEVVRKPSDMRKSGVCALLWYVIRGTSSRLHSRAEKVLLFLTNSSIFDIGSSDTIVEVLTAVFQRLCEELQSGELNLMLDCLLKTISGSGSNERDKHLTHLLSLLISTVQFSYRGKISDYQPMLELVGSLERTFIMPPDSVIAEDCSDEVVDKVLQLMLCLLDGLCISKDKSAISRISLQWAPVFELRIPSLLTFIRELLLKDLCVIYAFKSHILSAMSDMIEASPVEVVYLMLKFVDRLQVTTSKCLDGISEEQSSKICSFLQTNIRDWIRKINDLSQGDPSSVRFHDSELSVLWGTLRCYPLVLDINENPSLLRDLIDAIDRLLAIEADDIAGLSVRTWQSLIGAALASYHKLHLGNKSGIPETSNFLRLAKRYKSSSQILFAVAEFLDSMLGDRPTCQADSSHKIFLPELGAEKAIDAIHIFSENLCHSDKEVRVATLRILCHYEPLDCLLPTNDQPAQKKLKTESSQSCKEVTQCSNVLQLLLSIEATPLSISTSRNVIMLISRIQMGLSGARISEVYVPLLLNGIVGIFHNRFSHLWEPAVECLTVLIEKYVGLVWDRFVHYLEQCQSGFLTSCNQLERVVSESSDKSSDLVDCFNSFVMPVSDSTPCTTVLSLLLQSLQKNPTIAESRSRQLMPLFLKFLGYTNDTFKCVGSFSSHACKGKEWKGVLKEWLNLLKLMRNPKSLYRSEVFNDVLINRLLDETDVDIQMKVLDCLLNRKDDFLLPYDQHLKNLITSKNLREELATWTLSKESHTIQEQHRVDLIPLVIRTLIPKVRKLKTLASRKNTSIHHRRAVLCFLAQLDVDELPLLFALLIKPLLPSPDGSRDFDGLFWSRKISMERFQESNFLEYFTVDDMANLSWKKRYGFLHVTEDILKVFDELRVGPFLNLLMGCVVRILRSCSLSLAKNNDSSLVGDLSSDDQVVHETDGAAANPIMTSAAIKQFKDLRSLCLKIISFTLNKYEDHDFGNEFWDIFFTAVKPLIDGFKQEGSSSERPSSLFSCFVAMSRSHSLVSLLSREENLVSTIFSILTVKTSSEAIISFVLGFIENLLNLDNDVDIHEDCDIKRVLLPNLEALICSLHCYFQSHNKTGRKSVKHPGKRGLRIFKLLSKYIKDPSTARLFLDILLPFLAKKSQNSDECMEGLEVVQRIIPVLGSETTGKILNAISPLLNSAGPDLRLSICDLLDGLAANDPSVDFLAKLIRELNAISTSEIDEFDYDTRVNAYEKISPEFFFSSREEHTVLILSHCVYDMSSEELILRQSGSRLLLSFVQFATQILNCGAKNYQQMPGSGGTFDVDVCWTRVSIQRIIKKFFLKHMGDAMSKEISIQKEWIALLREMVLKLPEIPALNSFKALCSGDAEVDFFNNILHLQKHRRARALSRFRNVINAGDFSEIITKKVFIPLFFNMLFDVHDGKGEHVRNACLETLASISGHMKWDSYYAFLIRCFKELTLKPDKEKVLLRLICSVLDHFHYVETCYSQETKDTLEVSIPVITGTSSSAMLHKSTNSGIPAEIQSCLQKTVLPKIQKLLDAGSGKLNVTISLIALKLLKLLPVDTMESQLPSIIHRISNFLKNRLESVRDEARSALAACCKELGLEYFQFIVRVLRATLKRGYELHVLGYTLHFLLSKSLSNPVVGKLDYCVEELLLVAENDILGDVSEEKEVEKIASKMKETRKRKSFETLKLMAQSITFKTHALKLLSPVKRHLQKHLTPKMKAKLETMLNHIAAGIECNPSVHQTELFIFVYSLIEDGTTEENLLGKDSSVAKPSTHSNDEFGSKINTAGRFIGYGSQSSHLITGFALGVLQNRLKNVKVDKKDGNLLSMLDPFVKLLGYCLSSKYEDILSAALRCLTPLIRLPLPSLEFEADKIKTLLLDIARKSGNSSSPLVQSCLRLLTILLRSTRITLSSDQLHMLIQFPLFVDLERNPSFIALSLLKAIVGRKLVVHEIYDLVTRVAELMVTSQVEPIRKKCSQVLLQFLLDYHLSEKRLQQHLDFLLANLSYEHSSGRETVLEMLHVILTKFPKSILDEQAPIFFLHLVVCLANDNDNKVRSMVGAVIKLLVGRISHHSLHPIVEYSLSWYMGEKQNLWSAAAQVLGLLVEALKKGFQRHISNLLPVAKKILKSALDVVTNKQFDYSNETTIPFWKESYYSLVMLEKLLLQFPELHLETDLEDIWEAMCEFLLHPHMWLRNISSRLVASYFAVASEASRTNCEKLKLENMLLMKPNRLFGIAVSLCYQLKAQLTDDAASNLLTQNLVFTICCLHSLVGRKEGMNLHRFWSNLQLPEQGHFLKALHVLGSRKGSNMFASLTSSVNHQSYQDSSDDLQSLLVSPLLKRLGKMALQMEDIQMRIVFNCFKMISSQLDQEGCKHYAVHMILPLYKVCEGFAGKVIADNVKQLADEVRENIRGVLGSETFVQVYNQIRKDLKAKRDKRKQEEKVMAVVNPMRNAKRKLRIAEKHRAHKKRKITKMGRWRS